MLTPVSRPTHTPATLLDDAASPLLHEPALFYAPPYERTVEDELAWHLVKYLDPACGLLSQHRVVTPAGPVWVDVVVETVGAGGLVRRIGLDVTAPEEMGDETMPMRDALLVGTGALDAHYRVDEASVLHRLHDVLAVLAAAEPALFTSRAHVNLERLATPDASALAVAPADTRLTVEAAPLDEEDPFAAVDAVGFTVERRVGRVPITWLGDYTRALDTLAPAAGATPMRRAA